MQQYLDQACGMIPVPEIAKDVSQTLFSELNGMSFTSLKIKN